MSRPPVGVPVLAALVGGLAGWTVGISLPRTPDPAIEQDVRPPTTNSPSLEILAGRLERCIEALQLERSAIPRHAVVDPDVDPDAPSIDPEVLDELLTRLDALEHVLSTHAGAKDGPTSSANTNWGAVEAQFVGTDLEEAQELLIQRLRLASLDDVLAEFGAPTDVDTGARGGLGLKYDTGEGHCISIGLVDGYVLWTQLRVDSD